MPAIISMLRGVNVGGHNKIRMEALCELCKSLRLKSPRTHIQSGNVIFVTEELDLPALAARMAKTIEKKLGVRTEVVLRSAREMEEVIAQNPFASRTDVPPNKLVVTFLTESPAAEARENIPKLNGGPEELHLNGRELYIYFPNGISGSKIPQAAIDRALKTSGTARNWNTVTRLLEIAREVKV